jgi:hypothetical protein
LSGSNFEIQQVFKSEDNKFLREREREDEEDKVDKIARFGVSRP